MNNTKFYYLYSILSITALSFFNPILYIYLLSEDFSFTEVGLYLSIFWLASFMTELPCGAITDNIGAKNSILLSVIFRVVGLILLLSNSLILLYISAILSAIAESFQSGTLTSWLVNVNNKNNEEIDIDKVLSRSSLYSLFFSALIGFVSAKYVYVYYQSLSIILSMSVFIIRRAERSASCSRRIPRQIRRRTAYPRHPYRRRHQQPHAPDRQARHDPLRQRSI